MAMADALRRDRQIDGLADGAACASKEPIVPGGIHGKSHIKVFDDFEVAKLGEDQCSFAFITQSSQHLHHDQRRQAESLLIEPEIEPLRLRIRDTVDEVDEDARVDDDH